MIKSLQIKNYALIEELEMTPSSFLNIITGETGAGKSIMLGAVGLLLGNRADTKVLFNEDEKCIVEGIFDISAYNLQHLFEEEELDFEQECVIRREISASGKSRAFINDTPTTLSSLKKIGHRLMDIHSQHESLQLGDKLYQLSVLDAFAGNSHLLSEFQTIFSEYQQAKRTLEKLEKMADESADDADYKQFLLKELNEAQLDDLDQEALEKELNQLENAEDIKLKLSQSFHLLDEAEISIANQLKEVLNQLNSISGFSTELQEILNRMDSTYIELNDLSKEIHLVQDKTAYDPERIAEVKEQLDLLYRLQKKHGSIDLNSLIELRDQLDESLSTTANLDTEIEVAKKTLSETELAMFSSGQLLSDARKLYAVNLADEIEKIIHKIGIENGTVEIKVTSTEPFSYGIDHIQILFSANKGVPPQELKDVASGGEFSRLIFAVKFLIADKTAMPTIIFDEIDTGVSGYVALQMIHMMKNMAKNHQVISISHLPQFAAGGDAHYFVYKDHSSEKSVSRIKLLQNEERIIEIAKMIGGSDPGDSAIQSAKELLLNV